MTSMSSSPPSVFFKSDFTRTGMSWRFGAYHNLSPWSRRPCDPGRRRNPDSRCCCFSGASSGGVWRAACCCCPLRPLRRPSCWPASCASCSSTGYCFWTGCCSTAAASCLKTTGWPWTACPEWPPVCWEMQVADCKYVNKKYTTTQPLHSSQHAGRGEEWEKYLEKDFKVDVNVTNCAIKHHYHLTTAKKVEKSQQKSWRANQNTVKSKYSPWTCDYFKKQLEK